VTDHIQIGPNGFDYVASHNLHVVDVKEHGHVGMLHLADDSCPLFGRVQEITLMIDEGVEGFEYQGHICLGGQVAGCLEAIDDALPLGILGEVWLDVARAGDHHRSGQLPAAGQGRLNSFQIFFAIIRIG